MGYYNGMGARLVTSIDKVLSSPQNQPNGITDPATGAFDCGAWGVSATWNIPSTAVSGIYFVKLVREDAQDPGGASHMVFVVRNDASTSDMVFSTSDATWQAYNPYGGQSLYDYNSGSQGHAFAVSYNRPFATRDSAGATWVFWSEYPMVRFLEANGYDVSYSTDIDSDRRGSLIRNHKIFLSVGHDEYWSGGERANVEAARDAGVNLAFFSGNEVFWKTRWANSFDGTNTPYRTLVCYKETAYNAPIDPLDPPIWTGTWVDPRFSPPADGGRPQNSLTGQQFGVSNSDAGHHPGDPMTVSSDYSQLRFWRNTSVAALTAGTSETLATADIIGYEFDTDQDNGFRPAGLFDMSATTLTVGELLLDYGSTYGPGTATHSLTLYRASSGALVFGAGTVQWAHGLDPNHDQALVSSGPASPEIQQATVNLFADMRVQPGGTLLPGLIAATASTDTVPPSSTITFPTASSSILTGSTYNIAGTATDTHGGVVAGIEVSVDGGATWHPATTRSPAASSINWTFSWTPDTPGNVTIRSRAVNDSGYLETPSAGVTVNVRPTDTTPPTISALTAFPTSNQAVTVTWTTDKASTSQVTYGTNPQALTQSVTNSTLVTAHSVSLTGLTPNTTYYYRVTSVDQFTNSATSPTPANPPASIKVPAFLDTAVADFSAGTQSGTTVTSRLGGGEVQLAPSLATPALTDDFGGTALSTSWTSTPTGVGTARQTVANSVLSLWATEVDSAQTFANLPPVQARLAFGASPWQGFGLASNLTSAAGNYWALFNTMGTTNTLFARVNVNGATQDVSVGALPSGFHTYLIQPVTGGFQFLVDGVVLTTLSATIPPGKAMKVVMGDSYGNSQPLQIDSVTVGGDSNGSFLSRVFDAGASAAWANASWDTNLPTNTSLLISVRMGNTAAPDSTWTDWVPLQTSGLTIGGVSRYLEYQAGFTSTNPGLTPVLQDISFFTMATDTVPPTIIYRSPLPFSTGYDPTKPIVVKFSELMRASTISGSTVHLRIYGQSTDVPATVTYTGSTVTLQPTTQLAYNTFYQVIVSGSITDASGNALGSDTVWTFTTSLYSNFTDNSTAGFSAGTQSGTVITSGAGGGIQIAPSPTTLVFSDDFSGTALSASWTSTPTGQGTARQTVSGSVLSLLATEVDSAQTYANLPPLEASLAFGASPWQSFGLATSLASTAGNYWAMFGTMGTTNTLFARLNVNGTTQDVNVGALPAGFHTYRIQPVTGGFQFLVDGTVLTSLSAAFPASTALKVVMGDSYGTYQPLQIDWVHVLGGDPPSASFTSRIFDAGATVTWASVSWDAAVPAGTNLAMILRMGNTATPDSTWTDWVPLSASGATIGGVSRYIQYQASLTNTSPVLTPVFQDLTFAFNNLPDTVTPTIESRAPASGATGVPLSAPVVVKFSELLKAATISNSTVHLRQSGQTTDLPATVTYSGSTVTLQPTAPLAYNTSYQAIVSGTISDASGNALGSDTSWSFTSTPYTYLTDNSASGFSAGTQSGTAITTTPGGGVQIAPSGTIAVFADDFSGSTLSTSWTNFPNGPNPRLTVAYSILSVWATEVDSVQAYPNLPPLEASVAHGASPWQCFGLATSLASTAGNYWALFDTMGTTNTLFARINVNGATQDVNVGALPVGFHTYRIQPVAGGFQFLVDGAVLTTLSAAFPASTALKVVMADSYGTYPPLQIDWAHVLGGYASSASFTSRVFDAGASVTWGNASWDAAVPAGTTLAISVRMGNTATPDSTWTDWVPLSASGATIAGASRYIQYQAALASTNPALTPVLQDLTLAYNTLPATTGPTIVSRSPAPAATAVPLTAPIVVKFSELMKASTISTSTIHLRLSGQTTDVAATVTFSGSTATLQPTVPLAGNASYQVIVSGTITDLSGNALGSDTTWSFTTGTGSWQQTTTADFSTGTQSGTQVASGGGVQLAPSATTLMLSDDFPGTSLSSSWTSTPTGAGPARLTVANSILSLWATEVDSAQAYPNSPPLEARVALGASPWQGFGLATTLASTAGYWALFDTMGTTNTLFARINVNGTTQDVNVGALPAGFHTYRIQPVAGGFQFLLDGAVLTTISAAFPASTALKVVMGDSYGTYQPLQIDWVHVLGGYPASGTFTSTVFDAGRTATWGIASWTANLPPNTSFVIQTRSGNTATPDATWSSWTTVANGGTVGSPSGRYLQYRIVFTTTDPTATATLFNINFLYT
jgi:hypothetical protein